MKLLYLIIITLLFPYFSVNGQDGYSGTWKCTVKASGIKDSAKIFLQLGEAKNNFLYPARLTIAIDTFWGDYDLLLVKKNIRQLAISTQKHPAEERPFSMGNATAFLNGVFDFSRNNQGQFTITANRIKRQNLGLPMTTAPKGLSADEFTIWKSLSDIFQNSSITLIKQDTIAWQDERAEKIFKPKETGKYFGITDTIYTNTRDGLLKIIGKKKNNTGVVSSTLNGKSIFDFTYLTEGWPVDDFKLDTGINYLAFYAEDFGRTTATTGTMELDLNGKKKILDFNTTPNIAATFILSPIYSNPPYQNLDSSQDVIIRSITELAGMSNQMVYYYPRDPKRNPDQVIHTDIETEKSLMRNATVVDNIKASTRQVLLAIWDDAVEDGDSISLNINGQWVVQGLPVKKHPQFISVNLDPGMNRIIFIADNEGGIPPNTSILEIIDGSQRRSFKIDTDLSRNNLVNILYELRE